MKKLNLGCGNKLKPAPWINVDWALFPRALQEGVSFLRHDLRSHLPFGSHEFDEVLIELALEHLWPSQATALLDEAYRVLMPTGVVRVVVPDGDSIFKAWHAGDCQDELLEMIYGVEGAQPDDSIHKTMFNEDSICDLLTLTGFRLPKRLQADKHLLSIEAFV